MILQRNDPLPTPSSNSRPAAVARPRYRWWHAAVLGLAANVASTLPAGFNGDPEFYRQQKTPAGAPPSWLFPPVWAVNNALTLWSNLRIANLPAGTPGRTAALSSEAVSWALFASFSGLYFGLRSPVLGAADTVAGLVSTSHGVYATARLDRAAAAALAPRLLWLAYASYVSVASALLNPDPLLGRPATPVSR